MRSFNWEHDGKLMQKLKALSNECRYDRDSFLCVRFNE